MAWRSSLITAVLVFLVALGIRLLYLRGAPAWPVSFGDGGFYLLEASFLLQGDWQKFLQMSAIQGPVYPVLISLVLLLSGGKAEAVEAITRNPNLIDPSLVLPIQVVQAVLGALTCVAVVATGKRTGSPLGRSAGLIGGFFLAVLPTHILYTSYTMTEVAATAMTAWAVTLAIGPANIRQQLGVGLMLATATLTRITVAYAGVVVPASSFFVGHRQNLGQRFTACCCGVLVFFSIAFGWRSLIIMAGGDPFVGAGGISSRLDAMVDSADASHFGWGDDRIPYYRVPYARPDARRLAAKEWILECDRNEYLEQERIQRWRVPPEVTEIIQGNYVHVTAIAPNSGSGVLPELRYVAPYQFASPWRQIRLGKPLEVHVPLTLLGNHHFVEVRGTDGTVEITKVELVFPRFPTNMPELIVTVARIFANGFMNFWYADTYGNIVAGSEQFPNAFIHGFQRFLLVLAGIGLGRAFIEFRHWAPIIALLAAGVMVGIDWIENRHNIPFMPALCLFAGLGTAWLGTIFFGRRRFFYPPPILIGIALLVLGAIGAAMDALSFPLVAWTPLSDLSLPLALAGGSVLLWIEYSVLQVVRRLAALLPIVIFLMMYLCFISTDPTPRWKHNYTNIPLDGVRLAQRFNLPDLASSKIVKSAVLLDIEAAERTAKLVVRLNGTVIAETMESARSRYPNDPNAPDPASLKPVWALYAAGQRPLDKWPQWWEIHFDPELLTPRVQIDISMGQSNSPPLRIGSIRGGRPGSFLGPSITRTSIYRWLTTGDWRFWESFPSAGKIESTLMIQNENISRSFGATLGIRLMTEDQSGNIALY
jgi:hypothetical protein